MVSLGERRSPDGSIPDPPGGHTGRGGPGGSGRGGEGGTGGCGTGGEGGTGAGGVGDGGDRIATELVAVLFAGVGSTTPTGTAIEVVLTSAPAEALTSPVNVNVAVPPGMSVTVVEIDPTPVVVAHADPGVAAQVQEGPVNAAENTLVTVAPETSSGPALLATMIHTSVAPGSTVVTPGLILAARSAVTTGVGTIDTELVAGA